LSQRFIVITQLKKFISAFKNDYKIAASFAPPVDDLLESMERKFRDDMATLTSTIKKISSVDTSFNKIYGEQKDCLEKMELIQNRQDKLGRFMVDLNNDNFKENYIKFTMKHLREQKKDASRKSIKKEENEGGKGKILNLIKIEKETDESLN
jgi:hypothetical protein